MNLKAKWTTLIEQAKSSGLNTLRFESDGPLELFLGIDSDKNRLVMIQVPAAYDPKIKLLKNENIELIFIKDSSCLIIRVFDSDYNAIFDDLISSLLNSIDESDNAVNAADKFLLTYFKWNSFFSKYPKKILGFQKILGLWGELVYLYRLLDESTNQNGINSVLSGWVGPMGAAHDFEFDKHAYEVKAKLKNSNLIRISSEFQLESVDNKDIKLVVISGERSDDGDTIEDMVTKCQELITLRGGDLSLFLSSILEAGLNLVTIESCVDVKIRLVSIDIYDCSASEFPKFTPTNLPIGISSVRYNLDCGEIEIYKIFSETF